VADFSRVLAGPYATMLLGDLGADVIKVEGPGGDDTRHWVPPMRGDTGTYYLAVNRNKRDIVLDLREPRDAEVAHTLSARADVFIHNFKPGGLKRFGLDYESVAARNPASIYCSISGFGTDAGATLPGYDLLVQGMSGLMSLTGDPDGPASRAGVAVFDVMTGLHAAIGILAALHHRSNTGEGQHVELNLLSTALSTLVNQASAYVAGGVVPHRMGNSHFSRFAAAIGAPGLGDEERFASVGARNDNRDQLRPLLLEKLAEHSAQEWFDILTAAGVPCGPINDIRGGVELAERLGLDPVVEIDGVPTVRNPVRMSVTPPRYDLPPPSLDADGDEIRAWLGLQ
jgi:crotonobetainyl-CoA:carnitine CoA-transferase CaiB-like acyl-CoA transferase